MYNVLIDLSCEKSNISPSRRRKYVLFKYSVSKFSRKLKLKEDRIIHFSIYKNFKFGSFEYHEKIHL